MRRPHLDNRDSRQPDRDEDLYATYGRPSVSAWVAAAAVAFAFFLLGGFIKTYRQLEGLREESRREIAELRDSVRRLQTHPPSQTTVPRTSSRITPLPQAIRRERSPEVAPVTPAPVVPMAQTVVPAFSPQLQPTPSSSMASVALASREPPRTPVRTEMPGLLEEAMLYEYQENQPKRPRYQVGRKGDGETGQLLSPSGGACQVVSVSNAQKRIMVEGGRDVRLDEGERLELVRDGRWIADLRVVDVFDNQSSCEVLHATLSPEPGDTIRRPPQSR